MVPIFLNKERNMLWKIYPIYVTPVNSTFGYFAKIMHTTYPVGKITKNQSEVSKEEQSQNTVLLSKIHSYRLLFRQFFPLGNV